MQTRENPRLVADRTIAVTDRKLNTLILELGSECQIVMTLINQLQLPMNYSNFDVNYNDWSPLFSSGSDRRNTNNP